MELFIEKNTKNKQTKKLIFDTSGFCGLYSMFLQKWKIPQFDSEAYTVQIYAICCNCWSVCGQKKGNYDRL